jgi:hypothetical protein
MLLARTGKNFGETDVVDATTGTPLCVIPDYGHLLRFSGPDRVVVVRTTESIPPERKPGGLRVSIYNARTGKRESGFQIPNPDRAEILGPVNGRREIVVGWGSTSRVEVWDLTTGKMVRGVTLPDAQPKGSWTNFAASPDGKRVTAHRRMNLPTGVYDTATGAEVATIDRAHTCEFVTGRDLILTHSLWRGDGYQSYSGLRAYDLTSKTIVADLVGAYLLPAITPDGRVMVTKVDSNAPELLVWDLTRIP